MPTKIILFTFFFLMACGKDVKFTNHLKSSSALSETSPKAVTESATLIRSVTNPPGKIVMSGKTYSISPFSSHIALAFIEKQQDGAEVGVKIRGETKGTEIYLKLIE